MRRAGWVLLSCLSVAGGELAAQAVPEGSQAARVQRAYRRTPHLRVDPFRHVMIPHWGLVFSAGASLSNNWLNLKDIRALIFLSNNDQVLVGDMMDALGLIPTGQGVTGQGRGEGGVHLGGPFGGHLSIGFSGQVREYGALQLNDSAVALLRDGNAATQQFPVGETRATTLTTGEAGAHAVLRFGPLGSEDGVVVNLGFGGRYVRALYYAQLESTIDSRLIVTGDTIAANVEFRRANSVDLRLHDGAGIVGDFLLRLEWPTSGLALEAMAANLGRISVDSVERSTRRFNVTSPDLMEVKNSLDVSGFVVQDTAEIDVTLPRIVRFSASAWANRILQLDLSATMPVSGQFDHSLIVDIGSTWRLLTVVPLRVGMVIARHHSFGFTGGIAIEQRNLYLQLAGASLGGLFQKATGAAARFEMGFFF